MAPYRRRLLLARRCHLYLCCTYDVCCLPVVQSDILDVELEGAEIIDEDEDYTEFVSHV